MEKAIKNCVHSTKTFSGGGVEGVNTLISTWLADFPNYVITSVNIWESYETGNTYAIIFYTYNV